MSFCDTCGKYKFSSALHKCPPQWEGWFTDEPESVETPRKVYANDAEEAAEEFASNDFHQHDGWEVWRDGDERTVAVKDQHGKVSTFRS